jgi:aspartate racemase
MLGILGGMGPMATVDFMTKVIRSTPASCDQEHVRMLVSSDTVIPDRTAAIVGYGADPFPAMKRALRWLELGGARIIAIPCNTAHHWHGALQAETDVPILHIVDAVADRITACGPVSGLVGIMATSGTVQSGVYQERLARHGLTYRFPEPEPQARIMEGIRLVKAGDLAAGQSILEQQAWALLDRGCSKVVMACTEIPIALADSNPALDRRSSIRPRRWQGPAPLGALGPKRKLWPEQISALGAAILPAE